MDDFSITADMCCLICKSENVSITWMMVKLTHVNLYQIWYELQDILVGVEIWLLSKISDPTVYTCNYSIYGPMLFISTPPHIQ